MSFEPLEQSNAASVHQIRALIPPYRPTARCAPDVGLQARRNLRSRRAPQIAQAAPPFPSACNLPRQDAPPVLRAEFPNPCSASAQAINKDKDRCIATTPR